MDTWFFVSVVAAVIVGNAASFAFFMAAMKCSQLEKAGIKDDRWPAWVYAGLIAPLLIVAIGAYLLT